MPFLIAALAFLAGTVYASFFEWALHRYILHSNRFLKYPFRAHQVEHHGIFRADRSYFLSKDIHHQGDENHLTFAPWHAPLLIALHAPLLAATFIWAGPWACAGTFASFVTYYGLYEYLHFCMHVPKGRWLERTGLFRSIQAHHRYHHVYYQRNLNVVFPIADFILGTRAHAEAGLYEKLEAARLKRRERAEAGVTGGSVR
jgi:hypothetical protein